eukprot:TRINITY_DN10115_c0_g1_i1.p1 TRINITY_DN10115_c0_g1~~TRINITY_DN10115_c0_g1_i1.p1  ORF type:complete len:313 (-),score=58.12 TRINITY_DN10115_c0_g1_i1:13-900(-)
MSSFGRYSNRSTSSVNTSQDDYNTGASQFAQPGGFSVEGEGTPQKDQGARSGAVVQTLTPLTVRQVYNAGQSHPDDVFRVDEKELNQVTLVGQISSVEVNRNVQLLLDDSTGKILVQMWLEVSDDQIDNLDDQKSKYQEGSYVRVVGQVGYFMEKRVILAFRILPVEDKNEITFHLLEAIYVHLYNTRGAPTSSSSVSSTSSTTTTSTHHAMPQLSQGGTQLNALQNEVFDIVGGFSNSEDGCDVTFIQESMKSKASPKQIQDAINYLSTHALIYNTIDESHFTVATEEEGHAEY